MIRIYASQGFDRFVLCLGHKGELIEEFVRRDGLPDGLDIDCVDTGEETPTGGRIAKVAERLGGERFCVTYSDGVADVDLDRLLAFHNTHGALASMTVVQPELQFGVAELNGDGQVSGFTEKPRFEGWINGGFFCFEPAALDYMADGLGARARAARAARGGRRAARLSPRRLLGLHGHLQGRRAAQRPLARGPGALETLA